MNADQRNILLACAIAEYKGLPEKAIEMRKRIRDAMEALVTGTLVTDTETAK